MIVQNQQQLPPEITPEACREYTKALPNPNNIKPSLTFGNIGRFCYARGLEFWHLGNTKRIAEALKKHYEGHNLSAADIAFFSKRVVKELDFVDQATLDQAQFHTPHTHVQQQLSKLALLKGNITPPSSPNAQSAGSRSSRQDSAGNGSAQDASVLARAQAALQSQAQSQAQSANGSGSGSASGSALGSDSVGAVDSVGSDDTALAPRRRRERSRRASTSDALDVEVSAQRGRGRGRRSSETDVQALAQANLAAQANAQAQSVAQGSGSSRPHVRPLHKINRESVQYEVQKVYAQKLLTPADRREAPKRSTELALDQAKLTDAAQIALIQKALDKGKPDIEHVKAIAKFLEAALKDGKKAEVLKVLGDLPIMAQLALLEVISDEYVDLVIEDMKESYIHMNNFDDSQKEKGNGLTVMQVRYTIFTYLEVHKDDAVVGPRYKKLIDALDPKA